MNREDIKQTMLLAMSEHHSGNAAEAQRIVDAILAAIEAAGVRLESVDRADLEKAARYDVAYSHGFRAGWNAGIEYEACQPVPYEREARGNPQALLDQLASMEARIHEARAALLKAEAK